MSHPKINIRSAAAEQTEQTAERQQPDDDFMQPPQPDSQTETSPEQNRTVDAVPAQQVKHAETGSALKETEEEAIPVSQPKTPVQKRKIKVPVSQLEEDEDQDWKEKPESGQQQDTKPTPAPAVVHYGVLNGLFNGFAAIGPIALLLLLGCMAWPMFWQQGSGVFCPAEIKGLSGFLHCIAQQSWLAPTGIENGNFTTPLWPVFSWWVGLFALVPQLVQTGLLLPTATFFATFLAAFAVWTLAIVAGFGRKAALASGIILLSSPIFAPLPHFVGPAALAAALMIFALVFFCRGWSAQRAGISLPLAFIFTALAGLCGGPLHLAVPLLASLFFLIWRATFRRAQSLDALVGFFLMLAIIGIWLGALMLGDGHETYFTGLMAGSVHFAWPIPHIWFLALIVGLIGLLPWITLILGVSWFHVLGHASKSLSAARHSNGSALCWLALILILCCSIFTASFHTAAIAIACLAAVLLGKAFINLGALGNRFFFAIASLFIILAGAVICLASFSDTRQLLFDQFPMLANVPDLGNKLAALPTLPIMGYICIAAGIIGLFFVKRARGCGGLIYASIVVIVLCQPARLMLVQEIAAMPNTPLVSYASVEKQVEAAMLPKAGEPAAIPAPSQKASAPIPEQVVTPAQPGNVEPATESALPPESSPATATSTVPGQTNAAPEQPATVPNAASSTGQSGTAAPTEQPVTMFEAKPAEQAAPPQAQTEEVIIVEEVKKQSTQPEASARPDEPTPQNSENK